MWARVPTDVKAIALVLVLIGGLIIPVQSSGWSFPGFSALNSTVNFYRGLALAEDGRVDEAVDSFRKSFGLPLGTQTTLTTKPPIQIHPPHQEIGVNWPLRGEPCDSLKVMVVKKPKPKTDCL